MLRSPEFLVHDKVCHSTEHWPPVVPLSSIQGSLPCSRMDITSCLDMVRPKEEEKNTSLVMLRGLGIAIQGSFTEWGRGRQLQKAPKENAIE